jgi:hypothetical protein
MVQAHVKATVVGRKQAAEVRETLILPAFAGRDAVAMRPSGWPVLKTKGSASAGPTRLSSTANAESNL